MHFSTGLDTRALRLNRAGPRLLRRLLRPLQPHPPPLGHRATHASISPLRHRHRDPSQAPDHPRRGLRGQPNTLPQQGTTRPSTPRGRLDQSTPRRGDCTEQLDRPCLIRLDRFRFAAKKALTFPKNSISRFNSPFSACNALYLAHSTGPGSFAPESGCSSFQIRTQCPKVPSTIPISGATCAIGRPDQTTNSTASARNSALNLRRFDMKQILLTSVSHHCTGAYRILNHYVLVYSSPNVLKSGGQ